MAANADVLGTILTTIKTKLAAITAGETYQTSVVSVSDVEDPPQEKTDATAFPYIWFGLMEIQGEGTDANLHHVDEECRLNLHLESAYTTASATAARGAILDLYADVKRALLAGNGNLGLSYVKTVGFGPCRIGTIQGAQSGFVSAVCTFEFSYRHSYSDPGVGA